MTQEDNDPSQGEFQAAQRLAAIVESSDDAIIGKDLNGVIQSWNRGAERIFGYSATEVIGKFITILIPAELHDQETMILDRIANGERIDRFETVRQRKDGSQIFVSLTVSPIRDQNGKIVGASKIGRDISDLKQSQERQALLLREMNHRVKNLFAVASGIVALSARSATTPKDLAGDVQSRLSALARAHELILPAGALASHATVLPELIQTVLQPYFDNRASIAIEGPSVECGPASSTSFALLFHEFATNSLKYGALSAAAGCVHIYWTTDQVLRLTWREQMPHHVAPTNDEVAGFGSYLVAATIRSLGGAITRHREDNSLEVILEVPLDRLGV